MRWVRSGISCECHIQRIALLRSRRRKPRNQGGFRCGNGRLPAAHVYRARNALRGQKSRAFHRIHLKGQSGCARLDSHRNIHYRDLYGRADALRPVTRSEGHAIGTALTVIRGHHECAGCGNKKGIRRQRAGGECKTVFVRIESGGRNRQRFALFYGCCRGKR